MGKAVLPRFVTNTSSMAGARTALCDEANDGITGRFAHVARQVDFAGIEHQQGANIALSHLRRSIGCQLSALAGLTEAMRSLEQYKTAPDGS